MLCTLENLIAKPWSFPVYVCCFCANAFYMINRFNINGLSALYYISIHIRSMGRINTWELNEALSLGAKDPVLRHSHEKQSAQNIIIDDCLQCHWCALCSVHIYTV